MTEREANIIVGEIRKLGAVLKNEQNKNKILIKENEELKKQADCSYAEGYNDAIAKIKEEAKYIKHD